NCFEVMLPPRTVATPSLTSHLSAPFHLDKSCPSKSTMASAGGPPGGPGSTTLGSGQTLPLWYSLLTACHTTVAMQSETVTSESSFVRRVIVEPQRSQWSRLCRE